LIRTRSRLAPSAQSGGAAASPAADTSGRQSSRIGERASPAVLDARTGAPVSDALAPFASDRSRRCTPTCSMSGTQPVTATSTPTPSNPDPSEDCGGAAATAITSGKHHRCHAGTAREAAAQPAQSASHAASNSLGQRHRRQDVRTNDAADHEPSQSARTRLLPTTATLNEATGTVATSPYRSRRRQRRSMRCRALHGTWRRRWPAVDRSSASRARPLRSCHRALAGSCSRGDVRRSPTASARR
jgi:hypothetical protein